MRTIFNFFLGMMALVFTSGMASAQSTDQADQRSHFALEIDPATFALRGYSVHLRIQPANSIHLLWGAGIYAMDMPAVFVNFNEKNRDKGWEVRLHQGYGFFGEYHFFEVNRKWFVGGQASWQEYRIENESLEGDEKFANLLLMGYAGYTFQPFNKPVYFKPWAGIGYSSQISGENELEGRTYDIAPITMFATFHVGYQF